MRSGIRILWSLLFCITLLPLISRADETAEAGKKVVAQWQQTVVSLVAVWKVPPDEQEGGSKEEADEGQGIIIDPNGLVMTAISSIDPNYRVNEAMPPGTAGPPNQLKEAKIILPDGTALPAQMIFRDEKRDLAFFRPVNAPEKPLPVFPLDGGAVPQLLDPVFVLYRLNAAANHAIAIAPDRIGGIVEQPFRFYTLRLPDLNSISQYNTGAPVFTENGQPIGILTLRVTRLPATLPTAAVDILTVETLVVVTPVTELKAAAAQISRKATPEAGR